MTVAGIAACVVMTRPMGKVHDEHMDVTLLYFDDCPHWRLADARLREALDHLGVPRDRLAGDLEVLYRASRLDSTVGGVRHLLLAEQILLEAERRAKAEAMHVDCRFIGYLT